MWFRGGKMMAFCIIVLLCSVVEMTTDCRRRCRRRRRVGVLRNILGIPKIPRHRSHAVHTKVTTNPLETKPNASMATAVTKISKLKNPSLATEKATRTPQSTQIINITMTLSITVDNVRGHSGHLKPSVVTSDDSIGDATTIGNIPGHPEEGKPSGGMYGGSIEGTRNSQGDVTTISNTPGHPGEGKPSGGKSDGSIGGNSEGDATIIGGHSEVGANVEGTEVPLCRTPSTSPVIGSSGHTTVRSANIPTTLPPITEHYIHWTVEGLLALLLLVLAICLAVKMYNSKTAAVSPANTQVPSGTTSYEEIGNINTSASTDSTQATSHEQTVAGTSGPVVLPEVVIAAGNLYENAREISRPRISSDHTYENLDAIMYEDMRQKRELEADDNYEKLHRGLSSSSRTPESDVSCDLYKSLNEGNAGPNTTHTPDTKRGQDASTILTHSETTDMDRFADVSDESNGHM